MNKKEFIKLIHRRIAQTSIGPSAIRNQGASGLISISRHYFENSIDLKEFRRNLTKSTYTLYLDYLTDDLTKKFPRSGRSWGAARKGINLFFRDVVYNSYLADLLKIPVEFHSNLNIIKNLEVPLDKDVATRLNLEYKELPRWISIKNLDKRKSQLFQAKALEYANTRGIARIHLDLEFWRSS